MAFLDLSMERDMLSNTRVKKGVILSCIFAILTPITIAISLFSLSTIKNTSAEKKPVVLASLADSRTGAKVYASLPSNVPKISGKPLFSDARVEIIRQYLKDYGSPLSSKADHIVAISDKYGLDFRLTTAIAQQESNLCKRIPPDTFNCWGWGIHSRGTLGFSSFEEGIELVTRGLKEGYIDEGLVTPEEIMSKYTPLSNGSWAAGVNKFLSQME